MSNESNWADPDPLPPTDMAGETAFDAPPVLPALVADGVAESPGAIEASAPVAPTISTGPDRILPIGVYRALPQQLHKGEMWTMASDRVLQEILTLPGDCFPPCDSRQAGVLMLRRCGDESNPSRQKPWVLVWLTALARRVQPVYRAALMPEDSTAFIASTVQRLSAATDDEMETLGELSAATDGNRESARRALHVTLGLLDAVHRRAADGAVRTRPALYVFQSPVDLADSAAALAIFARDIFPNGSFAVINGPPPQRETDAFLAVDWNLIICRQPGADATPADVDESTFDLAPVEPWTGPFRGIPMDQLRWLDGAAFDDLFAHWQKSPHTAAADWQLRVTVPHRLLPAAAMTDQEWRTWCDFWKQTADPAAIRRAADSLIEAKQDRRLFDLAQIETRTGKSTEISRLLLNQLGLDAAAVEKLVQLSERPQPR